MNSVYNNHREANTSFEEVERVHDEWNLKLLGTIVCYTFNNNHVSV